MYHMFKHVPRYQIIIFPSVAGCQYRISQPGESPINTSNGDTFGVWFISSSTFTASIIESIRWGPQTMVKNWWIVTSLVYGFWYIEPVPEGGCFNTTVGHRGIAPLWASIHQRGVLKSWETPSFRSKHRSLNCETRTVMVTIYLFWGSYNQYNLHQKKKKNLLWFLCYAVSRHWMIPRTFWQSDVGDLRNQEINVCSLWFNQQTLEVHGSSVANTGRDLEWTTSRNQILLPNFRQLWVRFKVFSGDTSSVDELATWVDAAVGDVESGSFGTEHHWDTPEGLMKVWRVQTCFLFCAEGLKASTSLVSV